MEEFNPDSPISNLVGDYDKVIRVIESCNNLEQLKIAESYVELFKQKYGQEENFLDVLSNAVLGKKMELNNGWEDKNKK